MQKSGKSPKITTRNLPTGSLLLKMQGYHYDCTHTFLCLSQRVPSITDPPVRYAEKPHDLHHPVCRRSYDYGAGVVFCCGTPDSRLLSTPSDKNIDPDSSVRGGSWIGLGTIQSVHGDHYTGAHHSPKSIINTRKIPVDKSHGAW